MDLNDLLDEEETILMELQAHGHTEGSVSKEPTQRQLDFSDFAHTVASMESSSHILSSPPSVMHISDEVPVVPIVRSSFDALSWKENADRGHSVDYHDDPRINFIGLYQNHARDSGDDVGCSKFPRLLDMDHLKEPRICEPVLASTSDLLVEPVTLDMELEMMLSCGKSVKIGIKTASDAVQRPKSCKRSDQPIYKLLAKSEDPILHHRNMAEKASLETLDETSSTLCDDQLWVEKYAPTKFSELLSDDKNNLHVLQWLAEWKKAITAPSLNSKVPTSSATFSFSKTKNNGTLQHAPFRKILLISGKPGLGKTTLAHIASKMMDFNVIEMNASDERSGNKDVKEKIKSAVSMNSLGIQLKGESGSLKVNGETQWNSKPNVLVLDEIDGAFSGSSKESDGNLIHFLTQLAISADVAGNNADSKDSEDELPVENERPGIKKKGKGFILKRPIICICNDPFSPTLRPLRLVAEHVQVVAPSMMNLVKRLTDICIKEALRFDPRALMKLAQVSEGDIRTCLSTLQLLRNNVGAPGAARALMATRESDNEDESNHLQGHGASGKLDVDMESISTCTAVKDSGNGNYFTVWQEIFLRKSLKSYTYSYTNQATTYVENSSQSRLSRLVKLLQSSCSDLDRLFDGCFEHYLTCSFYDHHLAKIVHLHDWIFLKESFTGRSLKEPALISMSNDYNIYVTSVFGVLFSGSSNPVVKNIPKRSYQAHMDLLGAKSTLHDFLHAPAHADKIHARYNVASRSCFLAFLHNWSFSVLKIRLDYIYFLFSILESCQSQLLKLDAIKKLTGSNFQFFETLKDQPILRKYLDILEVHDIHFEKALTNDTVNNGFNKNRWNGHGVLEYIMSPNLKNLMLDFHKGIGDANAKPIGHWNDISKSSATFYQLINTLRSINTSFLAKKPQIPHVDENSSQQAGSKKTELKLRADAEAPKVNRDFFGRIVSTPMAQVEINGVSDERVGAGIASLGGSSKSNPRSLPALSVRYHEGFSNAVRKTVKFKDFLALFDAYK